MNSCKIFEWFFNRCESNEMYSNDSRATDIICLCWNQQISRKCPEVMVMMDITVIAFSCEGDVRAFLLEAALLNSI